MHFMTKHYAHQVDSNFNVLKLIKKFDANNDGVLSADELLALLRVGIRTQTPSVAHKNFTHFFPC
jgi:Ca2+-binding EF-hand superfamily protein